MLRCWLGLSRYSRLYRPTPLGVSSIESGPRRSRREIRVQISELRQAEHAKAAGADEVINYKADAVPDRVREITRGRGVDRIVEVDIAGNAMLVPKIIAQGGLCAAYGSNAAQACFDFGPMILSGAAVRFFIVYELSAAARERGVSDLTRWMEEGRVKHAIATKMPWNAPRKLMNCSSRARSSGASSGALT